jgi:hypothetical protein
VHDLRFLRCFCAHKASSPAVLNQKCYLEPSFFLALCSVVGMAIFMAVKAFVLLHFHGILLYLAAWFYFTLLLLSFLLFFWPP